MQLANIHIVLSHTTHPGNVGATARAMKTMGLSQLRLINPKNYPSHEATVRASRADDILQQALVVNSLDEALADCQLVIGTSARQRRHDAPLLTPAQLAELAAERHEQTVAILFGTENSGLTNEELSRCHYQVYIPANPDYSSLNLASAVQLIAYELRMKSLEVAGESGLPLAEHQPVNSELMEGFFDQLIDTMKATGYYRPEQPKQLLLRIRRLFNRIQPDHSEYQILRGFLTSIQNKFKS